MHKLTVTFAVVVAVAVAAGCGSSSSTTTAVSGGKPVNGGVLTGGMVADGSVRKDRRGRMWTQAVGLFAGGGW